MMESFGRPLATSSRSASRNADTGRRERPKLTRAHLVEAMEPRCLMAADLIEIGAVYIEEDSGSDLHGDTFYITFTGGAADTQLTRVVIDGDINQDGFGLGDLFFDTVESASSLGADHAFAFQIIQMTTANPNATVTATVQDGSTKLILDFTNFKAGDRLVFSIDVDEVQFYDASETDVSVLNDGFDPITSGVEFQNSIFKASFSAPHYQDANGQSKFLNRYDPLVGPFGLNLPADNADGKRDRSAGTAFDLQQIPKPISLSGIVYVDSNEDLTLQPTETRLSNVTLELFKLVNGNYVSTGHTTTTDAQGRYSFGTNLGLEPGTYQVRESQPAGYYSVGATPGRLNSQTVGSTVNGNPDVLTTIAIPLGDSHVTELNFAENLPSSISGHVCYVISGYDCFSDDSEKAPLSGVTINLLDANNSIIATTQTGIDGKYTFANLRAGTYSIEEITPVGYIDGDAKVGSAGGVKTNPSRISQVLLVGGVTAVNYDFCELLPAEISGHTYYDQNNNGRRDTGEIPLSNVLIQLFNEGGTKVAETRTNAQGYYEFIGLKPGVYRVTETTPPDYLPGQASAGTVGGVVVGSTDSTGDVIRTIGLPSGAKGINYDFGEILAGSIAGRVIVDINGNCIVDAVGEMVLSGVTVQLLDQAGSVIATTVTDVNGEYLFDNLLAGTYSVRELQPVGYFQGGQKAGTGGGDDSSVDLISGITIQGGDNFVEYIFCEVPPSSLEGYVYVDTDEDCVRDPNEVPIAGVRITLLDENGNVVGTTTTDSTGRYRFDQLRAGNYTVVEEQPAGYFQGGQVAGSGGGDASVQDRISSINIGAGVELVDYDFCELLPGSIAGIVFADLDFDCLHDPNEVLLSGVRIDLLDGSGSIVATTFTDSSGKYSFGNLRPGKYSVRETQPAGYFQGGQMAPATGGDASQTDVISSIILVSGQSVVEANFCEVPPAQISGYVFQDGDVIVNTTGTLPDDVRGLRDGQRTADDKPLAGVVIRLRNNLGDLYLSSSALPGVYSGEYIEVVTDANGFFHFTGLRSGIYNVFQTQPNGYVDGIDTPGTGGGLSFNSNLEVEEFYKGFPNSGLITLGTRALRDGVLGLDLKPGDYFRENNFSEVLVDKQTPVPPIDPPPVNYSRPDVAPPLFAPMAPLGWRPLLWEPQPLIVGYGSEAPLTWHLSVINGGNPRGVRNGERIEEEVVADNTDYLNVVAWSVDGIQDSTWHISSRRKDAFVSTTKMVFDIPGAKPLAGDFNGDGYDELSLFLDGEWFIDINGNGRWDESDIWLRLGEKGDQPVVGDWDGDGKDDVGIFGRKWSGDERALANEHGLPDPENFVRVKPKNIPPKAEEAPDAPRLMKNSHEGEGRADLIDHVFRFGSGKDIAVSGDFNGDGIASVGIFRNGKWTLDSNGDGRIIDEDDRVIEFGAEGDIPLVGDFDGDGIDELAIVRGRQVIVDSNGNGRIDATDQVFMLESDEGTPIVGDFDGDGRDEPALHQNLNQRRSLQARAG